MALNAENKLGFVDGTLSNHFKCIRNSSLGEVQCMVSSWILNAIDETLTSSIIYGGTPREIWLDLEERFSHNNNPRIFHLKMAICTLQQDHQPLVTYYDTLKSYWDELSTYDTIHKFTCGAFKTLKIFQETERTGVYQILMGLNDTYSHIRSQMLAMDPLPSVSNAYAIINQEEKQRLLHLPSSNSSDSVAMTVNTQPQKHPTNLKVIVVDPVKDVDVPIVIIVINLVMFKPNAMNWLDIPLTGIEVETTQGILLQHHSP